MSIFEDFERTYDQPATHGESTYSFLNRSNRPAIQLVRSELEAWLLNYPESQRKELIARFRPEFHSPFFELLLHEMLLRMGATITIHPDVGTKGKRPEFQTQFSDGKGLIVEATLCTDEDAESEKERNRIAQVYDAIDRMDSPYFWLNVHVVEESLGKQIAPKRVKAFLARELNQLNPDEVLDEYLATHKSRRLYFDDAGTRIEFSVIPKKREAWGRDSRVVGIHSGRSRWGGSENSLIRVLSRKGKHYGQLDLPFLVAVNTLGSWGIDEEDRLAALFGTEQEYVCARTEEIKTRNLANGIWGSAVNPKYTRVSAVLMGMALPWNVPRIDFCLYLNPWAEHHIGGVAWPFRTATWTENRLKYRDPDSTMGELLNLPNDWPGPFFD